VVLSGRDRSSVPAGIDLRRLPGGWNGQVIRPQDAGYRAVRSTYLRGGSPAVVLRPSSEDDVAAALAVATDNPSLPLGIRSGGHGVSGRSTNHGGIVLDLRDLNRIEVLDEQRRLVRVGPGARWGEVAAALHPYGWAIPSGDHGGVGVGGLATSGGLGLISRAHGLTIDRLDAAELLVADGSTLRVGQHDHPELFWGIRGAGSNFGIVTAFEFRAAPVNRVGLAEVYFDVRDIPAFLVRFGGTASSAPRDTTAFLTTGAADPNGRTVVRATIVVDTDLPPTIEERLRPFIELDRVADSRVVISPYAGILPAGRDELQHGHGEPHSRSALIDSIDIDTARDVAELLMSGAVYFFQIRTLGGAINDVAPESTAYPHRSQHFHFLAMGERPGPLDRAWSPVRLRQHGLYTNFESDLDPRRLQEAFPPPVLARLQQLKRRYDPTNIFRDNFPVGSSGEAAPTPAAPRGQD
jgi:hypothetical protein